MSLPATILLTKLLSYVENGGMQDAMFQSALQMRAEIDARIFNSEIGAKDIAGAKLGTYTKPYAKQRAKLGYQVAKKDLEVTGDLRRSINVDKEGTGVRMYFNNSQSLNKGKSVSNISKAKGIQQFQIKKGNNKIWNATNKEKKNFFKTTINIIEQDLKELANTI